MKTDWYEVRSLVQKASIKGFKCAFDYYDFFDISEEDLIDVKNEAERFFSSFVDEISTKEEEKVEAGFYLELNGRVVAGPFESQEKALQARARSCAPPPREPRGNPDDYYGGGFVDRSGRATGFENTRSLKMMNAYKMVKRGPVT